MGKSEKMRLRTRVWAQAPKPSSFAELQVVFLYETSIKTYWEEKLMVGYLPPIVQVNLTKVHPMHLSDSTFFQKIFKI